MNKELIVEKINNYILILKDKTTNQEKEMMIEFLDFNISIGDTIFISEQLLNDIQNQFVSFGDLQDISGRNLKEISKNQLIDEVIVVVHDNNKFYLKRLYG